MTLIEFEDFLSSCILKETNRVFDIVTKEQEEVIYEHLKVIRSILGGLTGGENRSIATIFTGLSTIRKIVKVVHSISPAKRLLLLIPHLSLIEGFSKLLVNTRGNTENLQMKDFFDYTSRFFVVEHHDQLTFIHRHDDIVNNANNRVFGVKNGFFCPGAHFVSKFIKEILEFLKSLDIQIQGEAKIETKRFRIITNKKDINVTFNESKTHQYSHSNDVNDEIVITE